MTGPEEDLNQQPSQGAEVVGAKLEQTYEARLGSNDPSLPARDDLLRRIAEEKAAEVNVEVRKVASGNTPNIIPTDTGEILDNQAGINENASASTQAIMGSAGLSWAEGEIALKQAEIARHHQVSTGRIEITETDDPELIADPLAPEAQENPEAIAIAEAEREGIPLTDNHTIAEPLNKQLEEHLDLAEPPEYAILNGLENPIPIPEAEQDQIPTGLQLERRNAVARLAIREGGKLDLDRYPEADELRLMPVEKQVSITGVFDVMRDALGDLLDIEAETLQVDDEVIG